MTRDGRGNDSFVPRCWECGHPVNMHHPARPKLQRSSGCWSDGEQRGTVCRCKGYRDRDDD